MAGLPRPPQCGWPPTLCPQGGADRVHRCRLLGDTATQTLHETQQPDAIYGIAKIELHAAYSFMTVYTPGDREQIAFWEAICDGHLLEGKLWQFGVVGRAPLPRTTPLFQCSHRRLRGSIAFLEAGQAENLWDTLTPAMREQMGSMPVVALHLPQLLCDHSWAAPLPGHRCQPRALALAQPCKVEELRNH